MGMAPLRQWRDEGPPTGLTPDIGETMVYQMGESLKHYYQTCQALVAWGWASETRTLPFLGCTR